MTIKLNLKQESKWGKYYGYPKCCIKNYLKYCQTPYWYFKYIIKYPILEKILHGFIPCEKHLKMIQIGKIKIEDLIKNRKCRKKYPLG